MRKLLYFLSIVIIISCQNDDDFDVNDSCLKEPYQLNNKIKGGNLLQTWMFGGGYEEMLDFNMVKKTNANWVSLSPIIELQYNGPEESPYYFPVKEEIYKMKKIIPKMINSGLNNIMLKPNLSFMKKNGSYYWSDFYMSTEIGWTNVEKAYEKLFYEFAKLSNQFPEFKILSIGTELREFTKRRPQFFKRLIAIIRKDFPNLKLTYAANWDEYDRITFWEDLDFIGVNPYFSLADKKTPTVRDIEIGLYIIKNMLKSISCQYKKPILFTEYGFRSMDFACWKPWSLGEVQIGNKVNFAAQENAYKAFYNTFWEQPWVAGGFFWEWRILAKDEITNPNNNGWEINDKPVEKIISERYKD